MQIKEAISEKEIKELINHIKSIDINEIETRVKLLSLFHLDFKFCKVTSISTIEFRTELHESIGQKYILTDIDTILYLMKKGITPYRTTELIKIIERL